MSEIHTAIPFSSRRTSRFEARTYRAFTAKHLDEIPELERLPPALREEMRVVSSVLPFRVNRYVIEELVDWRRAPDDPLFRLVFPQREMLAPEHFDEVAAALESESSERIAATVAKVRSELNPHPAGQLQSNVPRIGGRRVEGLQHKYPETVLFFPSQGQVCHSYCTFCFRWAQFIGDPDLRIASRETAALTEYLAAHPEVTDVLVTGGDPLVMRTKALRAHLEPLLAIESIRTIRIGTKSLTFWPHRFVTDPDAEDLLALFRAIVASGKHLAVMAHYNHPRELAPAIAREAIARVRATGAQIRAQGPLLAHINDSEETWARLWQAQVELGIVPYYMFVERDTGARRYFEVPLVDAYRIYRGAMKRVSGLARTARGPSMSCHPGKIEIQGVTEVGGEKVFVLRFIQGRNPDWVQRPFFARFDAQATWLDQLRPAFGEPRFFFERDPLN
ncbi:MAG: lysine 2,3-aminomutase [Myxococcales bacterium]|nr:lysine 2,3-aminomutase [Myxococcales bacterium]